MLKSLNQNLIANGLSTDEVDANISDAEFYLDKLEHYNVPE